jgi:formylglycine-generating enzyme required for sulfatase activity
MADVRPAVLAFLGLAIAGCWGQAVGASGATGRAADAGTGRDKADAAVYEFPFEVPKGMRPIDPELYPAMKDLRPFFKDKGLQPFFMDVLETTVAEYRECVRARRCTLPNKRNRCSPDYPWEECNYYQKGREHHPIDCVDYWQARNYCEFRHKRLPTPAEWDFAAGFSDRRGYPWGNEPLGPKDVCWMRTRKQGTCRVGTHPKDVSPFGILDMAGNAIEWVAEPAEWIDPDIYDAGLRGRDWEYKPSAVWPVLFFRGLVFKKGEDTWAGIRCADVNPPP